jgi:hypothetical protein
MKRVAGKLDILEHQKQEVIDYFSSELMVFVFFEIKVEERIRQTMENLTNHEEFYSRSILLEMLPETFKRLKNYFEDRFPSNTEPFGFSNEEIKKWIDYDECNFGDMIQNEMNRDPMREAIEDLKGCMNEFGYDLELDNLLVDAYFDTGKQIQVDDPKTAQRFFQKAQWVLEKPMNMGNNSQIIIELEIEKIEPSQQWSLEIEFGFY